MSSTRSSELNPSSAIVVSGVMSRPDTNRPMTDSMVAAAEVLSGLPVDSPAAHCCWNLRLSFCVPSVRGRASPGQTDVLHTRW